MWFCAALLIFSVAFALIQTAWPHARSINGGLPGHWAIIAFLIVLSTSTFLVRIVFPENQSVLNVHLGDFPQYLLMFSVGIVAYRAAWLERFPDRSAVRWSIGSLLISIPLLHGLSAPAVVKDLLLSLSAFIATYALAGLVFRRLPCCARFYEA